MLFFYWCNDSSRTTKQRVKSLVFQKSQALPAHFVDLGTLLDCSTRRSPGAWWNGGCVMVCKKRKGWTVPVPVLVLQKTCWFFGDVYWKAFLKKKSDAIILLCNKGVLGTWKQEHRELFRDDVREQHAVNWFGTTHPNYIPRCFSFSVKKMMLRLPWAIFDLPDCKMYLWKHRSLPLSFFLPKLCVLRL